MKDTITPTMLAKRGTVVDASGVYDWEKQSYKYDCCKFGTHQNTQMGTSSYVGNGTMPMSDDTNYDNYSD